MKTLLIVDDHPAVLEGLRSVMRVEGYATVAVTSAAEAIRAVKSMERVDVTVVDVSLSSARDGLDLIRDLRGLTRAPVVIYTMHGEMWNMGALVQSGAEGIVLKGDSIDSLIEAVRIVSEGGRYRSPDFSERIAALEDTRDILSDLDISILRQISEGIANDEIAGRMCVSKKTVEYHRSNIIKKLGSNNMAQAIQKAVRLGILTFLAASAPFKAHSETPFPNPIDLGLSVRWADCNLGASAPHEPGGYYAFGEVTEKDYFDWSTYVHCDDGDMFSQHDIGDESICGTEYDAARVLLGDDWRMPTAEEMEELVANCTVEYVTGESPVYVRFTAPNGAYIDIPVAGYMSLERVVYYDINLAVWTGSFYLDAGEEDGFIYYMNGPYYLAGRAPNVPFVIEGSPQLGIPIRPVYAGTSGITASADSESAPAEIYTIDGRRMPSADTLSPGLYISRHGQRATKVLVK